jgi:hypothetical protein
VSDGSDFLDRLEGLWLLVTIGLEPTKNWVQVRFVQAVPITAEDS